MAKTLNRRAFLKRSSLAAAGAIGFPYFIRPSALGLNRAIAPSSRLQMAQIGCGSMGSGNMNSFLSLGSQVQVIAVCDVDSGHLDSAKNRVNSHYNNSDCRTYKDFRELLAKEQLDIVSHALPDHWHALVSVACAKQGIDIYGEKPLARTIGEGRAICDAVKRYGVIWQTGSWQRSVSDFRRAAELVINGRIGKVDYVEVGLPDGSKGPKPRLLAVPDSLDWEMWLGPAPWRPYQDFGRGSCHWDWRWIMDYSGGQLTDWAGHHIDIAHWGLGLDTAGPVEIEGKGEYPEDGIWNVPYAYEFTCTYADGLKIRVANAAKQPHGMGTCWYGRNGWIHVSRSGLSASDPKLLQERIGPNEIQLYKSDHHQRNFVECVRTRQETVSPAEVAHRSISVGLLGEVAMLLGRKLRWDPKAERFVNDAQADRYLRRAFRSPWMI
jgi:predicted dehydrogenase